MTKKKNIKCIFCRDGYSYETNNNETMTHHIESTHSIHEIASMLVWYIWTDNASNR